MKHIVILIIALALPVLMGSCGSDSKKTTPSLRTPPTVAPGIVVQTFDFEGDTYEIVDGDAFLVTLSGTRVLIDHLYDPNFYALNYISDSNGTYRIDGSDRYKVTQTMLEGFEDINHARELIGPVRGWTFFTLQDPNTPVVGDYVTLANSIIANTADFELNRIDPSVTQIFSGQQAMRFYSASPSASMVTAKCTLDSGLIHFVQDDNLWYSAMVYIESGTPMGLVDFECSFILNYPGIRVLLDELGVPRVELKWGNKPTYRALTSDTVPAGDWFRLTVNIKLSADNDGIVRLWIDDALVIDEIGQTLPVSVAVYNNVEIGITANPLGSDAVMYVDDLYIGNKPRE